jgi:hypothetical protein
MNHQFLAEEAESHCQKNTDQNRLSGWRRRVVASGLAIFASIVALIYSAVADQPILTIVPLGTNTFSIGITNGLSSSKYTLYWTPVLGDLENYPWEVLGIGGIGQTNFIVDGGDYPFGFFRVMVGEDSDGDSVPDWQDAQPYNSSVGVLSLTIDSPLNGASLN